MTSIDSCIHGKRNWTSRIELASVHDELAQRLLASACYERSSLHLRPLLLQGAPRRSYPSKAMQSSLKRNRSSSLHCLRFLVFASKFLPPILLTSSYEQGRPHYVEGADSDEEGWLQMLKISLSRPLVYLFTEPIVTALSLAIGFVWGTVFLIVSSRVCLVAAELIE